MRTRTLALLLVLAGCAVAPSSGHAQTTSTSVQLTWTTPGDDSLTGTASQFDLRYSTSIITSANFSTAARWAGTPTPTAPGTTQSVTVTGLTPNTTYWFAIKTADEVPNWAAMSNVITRTTPGAADAIRPAPVANLAITGLTETTASLGWTAVGDDSLTGTATSYDLRYSTLPITTANWATATQVTGEPTPGAPGAAQSITVTGLSRQTRYYFALKVSDEGGNLSALSNVPTGITPDLTRPASITNLTPGFVWIGLTSTGAPVGSRPSGRLERQRH